MRPALRAALTGLLPDPAETLLLRSCLASGAAGREAWEDFQREPRELTELFRTDRGELKRLGPLLFDNLRRNAAPADARLLTVLKTGLLREELRARIYQEILGQALGALGSVGIDPLVLGGAALAHWAYGDPALRHCHDIDLLVRPPELAAAEAALLGAGFAAGAAPAPGTVVVSHGTRLPVMVRTALFELSCHEAPLDALQAGSRLVEMGRVSGRVLGPEDSLAHVLGRAASSPRRSTLQWAADAWQIAARAPALDRSRVLDMLGRARLLVAGAVLLRYLVDLGAPIPGPLARDAERQSDGASRLERDLALYGLRRGCRRGLLGVLGRLPDTRTRLAMLGWLSFPSPAYVRWAYRLESPLLTPLYYLARAGSGVAAVVRTAARPHRPVEDAVAADET